MSEPFADRYRAATGDAQLAANLLGFQRGWRAARDARFAPGAAPAEFEELRARLVAAKDDAIARQPELLARFTERVQARGVAVHTAATAGDAAQIVLDICRAHGATAVIKTKSMATEEIHLNHHLAAAGVEATETDVGEWIVQLRGETPSHMVMPAIHLDRRQVAATLRDATHMTVPDDDVTAQVGVVRGAMRPHFMGTPVGITGANALVVDSGAVLLVTNEGNEGLLTAMVDVLVVVAGVEKVVASLADAVAQVRLLARSATGQAISTYTTLLSAPAGGQEMHVVLLDNGRSAMRDDPEFRDALRCIRCAACASVCPPYQVVGGQVFGHVYSGAIGLVNTPFHHGIEAAAGPQSLCVSCNACQTVCPVDIPLPRQILAVRRRAAATCSAGTVRRAAFAVWRNRRLSGALMTAAALAAAPLRRRDNTLRIPRPPRHRWRAVPAPAARPAHQSLPLLTPGAEGGPLSRSAARGLRAALLIQCVTDRFSPSLAHDTVRVLAACGVTVVVPPAQHCCGLPLFDAGDWDGARTLAQHMVATLEAADADWVVTAANSCVAMAVHEYPALFDGLPEWRRRAERLARRTLDVATFLARVAQLPDGALATAADPATYTYHPFCQTQNVLHADGASRRLLQDVCGIALRELPEATVCCGFGGSTSLVAPEVGRGILQRKLANVDSTGADVLVSDNPGCLLHLRMAAIAGGRRSLRTAHVVEVLARRLDAVDAGATDGQGAPTRAQKRA